MEQVVKMISNGGHGKAEKGVFAAYVLFPDGVLRLKKKTNIFQDVVIFAYGDGHGFSEVICFYLSNGKPKPEMTIAEAVLMKDNIIDTWMH